MTSYENRTAIVKGKKNRKQFLILTLFFVTISSNMPCHMIATASRGLSLQNYWETLCMGAVRIRESKGQAQDDLENFLAQLI